MQIPLAEDDAALARARIRAAPQPATQRNNLALWAWFARRPAAVPNGDPRRCDGTRTARARRRGRFASLPMASGWTAGRDLPAPEGETFFARYARAQRERRV